MYALFIFLDTRIALVIFRDTRIFSNEAWRGVRHSGFIEPIGIVDCFFLTTDLFWDGVYLIVLINCELWKQNSKFAAYTLVIQHISRIHYYRTIPLAFCSFRFDQHLLCNSVMILLYNVHLVLNGIHRGLCQLTFTRE